MPASTCAEQYGTHGCGHTCTDGGDIRFHELHGIIDGKTGRNLSARGVQIQRNIGSAVVRSEEKQLCLNDIGHIIINRNAQEYDTVHHQTAEHIHGSDIELALLDNGRMIYESTADS